MIWVKEEIMDIKEILIKEMGLGPNQVENTIKLIDEGNTIPFIARYRKEMTGEMTDVQLREFGDRLTYLRNLEERKEDVKRLIDEQDKLDKVLVDAIDKAKTLQEVEDIYAPFKQKKRTRATIAKERGLEPLANMILLSKNLDIVKEAEKFVDSEKGLDDIEKVIGGARDILAEVMSDDAEIRKYIRNQALKRGQIQSKAKLEEDSVYRMYYDFTERVEDILPHRTLAINRGEKEGFLTVKVLLDDQQMIDKIIASYKSPQNVGNEAILEEVAQDAYKRLIFPAIERGGAISKNRQF